MFAGGIAILFIAFLAWVGFGVQKYKAGRLADTPLENTGDVASKGDEVAGDKGAISAEGDLQYDELLESPVTGTQCLYYRLDVNAEWKSGEETESHHVTDEEQAAPFSIDDGSGPVQIDASEGGDLEDLEETFDEKRGPGIVSTSNSIEFGENGFSVMTGQKVRGVRIPDDAKYHVEEEVLRPMDFAYANGKVTEDNAIGSPSWASLILSSKTYDEIVESTEGFAQKLMYGASAATVVGAALTIVAQVM